MERLPPPEHNPTVTFARLFLEIRRRAAAMPDDGRKRVPFAQVVREALQLEPVGPRRALLTQLLYGIASAGKGEELDPRALDSLNPETILRLDMLIDGLTGGGPSEDVLKAIRAALVRPVN